MNIDKFIDYDFSIVPGDQSTGLIEQPPDELLGAFSGIPWFDDICAEDMVPRSDWPALAAAQEADLRATVAEIYSQGRTSACVGFGSAQATETTGTRRYGRKHRIALAGMSVYDQIGRSLMSGAYIPDGIAFCTETGPLPLRTPANQAAYECTFPGLEYRWNRPAGWQNTSKLFRVTKAAKAQGPEMIASALLKRRCGIVGRKKHCVPYCLLKMKGNSPLAGYANSWSKDWGDAGWGYDSESVFGSLIMYVILEVAVRPDLAIPALAA